MNTKEKFGIGALIVGGLGLVGGLIYKSIKSTTSAARHMATRGHHLKRR